MAWAGAALYFPALLALSPVSDTASASVLQPVAAILAMGLLVGVVRRASLLSLAMMLIGSVGLLRFAGPEVVGALTGTGPHLTVVGPQGPARFLPFLAADVVVGFIVAHRTPRIAVAAAVMALTVELVSVQGFPDPVILTDPGVEAGAVAHKSDFAGISVIAVLALVTACMVGALYRERREHAAALRSQAVGEAVTAERLRIAREMHDMVAHNIGIVALQTGAARRVIDTQPGRARDALGEVETASRETLAGLRRMLGALRQAEVRQAGAAAPLDEAPGLAGLDRLVATAMAAGVHVDVRWKGERRPLPPEIETSAYRIIQESVTNVAKHASTDRCTVTIDCEADELSIEIRDNGQGCDATEGNGFGLLGIRERVSLLRGDFSAGPCADGGFRVAVRLPVPAGVQ